MLRVIICVDMHSIFLLYRFLSSHTTDESDEQSHRQDENQSNRQWNDISLVELLFSSFLGLWGDHRDDGHIGGGGIVEGRGVVLVCDQSHLQCEELIYHRSSQFIGEISIVLSHGLDRHRVVDIDRANFSSTRSQRYLLISQLATSVRRRIDRVDIHIGDIELICIRNAHDHCLWDDDGIAGDIQDESGHVHIIDRLQ